MIEDVQWILDALAADKTKTRSGLAKALGLNKSQITRLLQGRRRLKASEIEPTENYLGVSAPWRASRGFGDEGASFTGPDIADKTSIIFGASVDIGGKWIVHRTKTPVNRLARPPSVENAVSIYGFVAPDAELSPRFKSGEIVWIDPVQPAKTDNDVMLVDRLTDGKDQLVIIGELIANNERCWIIKRPRAAIPESYPKSAWEAYLILPRY